jgi:hypothetical protein
MAIIRNCELWYTKLDPNKPNKKFNKENPTWEVQIRTTDRGVRKEWLEMGLKVKDVIPEEGVPYYRVNLKKKTIKADKTAAEPVDVVDGSMKPVDPNSIGHGSIGHVRVFQYEYVSGDKRGIASMLMGIQLIKHIVYVPTPGEDSFEATETEVISQQSEDHGDEDADVPFEVTETVTVVSNTKPTSPSMKTPTPIVKKTEVDDDGY